MTSVKKLLTIFPVVAIVGVRQCGKSSLAKYIGSDCHYVDLEDVDMELLKQISESLAGGIAVVELGTLTGREQSHAKPSKLYSLLEKANENLRPEDMLTLSDQIVQFPIQFS